jgi:hypothetical protein
MVVMVLWFDMLNMGQGKCAVKWNGADLRNRKSTLRGLERFTWDPTQMQLRGDMHAFVVAP